MSTNLLTRVASRWSSRVLITPRRGDLIHACPGDLREHASAALTERLRFRTHIEQACVLIEDPQLVIGLGVELFRQ